MEPLSPRSQKCISSVSLVDNLVGEIDFINNKITSLSPQKSTKIRVAPHLAEKVKRPNRSQSQVFLKAGNELDELQSGRISNKLYELHAKANQAISEMNDALNYRGNAHRDSTRDPSRATSPNVYYSPTRANYRQGDNYRANDPYGYQQTSPMLSSPEVKLSKSRMVGSPNSIGNSPYRPDHVYIQDNTQSTRNGIFGNRPRNEALLTGRSDGRVSSYTPTKDIARGLNGLFASKNATVKSIMVTEHDDEETVDIAIKLDKDKDLYAQNVPRSPETRRIEYRPVGVYEADYNEEKIGRIMADAGIRYIPNNNGFGRNSHVSRVPMYYSSNSDVKRHY